MSVLIEDYLPVIKEQGFNTAMPINLSNATSGAFALGPNGSTNPAFSVDSSATNLVAGIKVTGSATGTNPSITVTSTATNEGLLINAKGSGAVSLNKAKVTDNTSQAFCVGPNGTANPTLNVNSATASAATGINLIGAAAGSGAAITAISSGTNESVTFDAKGSGLIAIGSTSTGLIALGRGANKALVVGSTLTALGTVQSTTPTAAQLLGGFLSHNSTTGAGTATLDTGTNISSAISGVAVGDAFICVYANLGSQTVTITGATGSTVIGTAAIPTGKNATLYFINTGSNTWNVYVNVSA